MRHERFWISTTFLTLLACSRETPAPPSSTTTSTPITNTATPTTVAPPVITSTAPVITSTALAGASYDDAMTWFRSAPAFHFVLDEADVRAEGDVKRKRIGSEIVQFRANGDEWRATAGPRGVMWEKRNGASWKAAQVPAFGNRVYQRVTLAFDPQKKEGSAQSVEPNHFRFTNANSGEVHDVWVTPDGAIERMKIGENVELTLAKK